MCVGFKDPARPPLQGRAGDKRPLGWLELVLLQGHLPALPELGAGSTRS